MKRVGHLYEQTAIWQNLVDAEYTATKRKVRNHSVKAYAANRWQNLVSLQRMILDGTIRTGEYEHEQRISGQNKLRDIAKLRFYPNHIWHKVLVDVITPRVDKALIRNTYASRVGYGQTRAALHIKEYLRKHEDYAQWYAQGDFVKYYDNIKHSDMRENLFHIIKDQRFINAFMEPFERFSDTGVGIPLGINPSQIAGNVNRMFFDRFATEEVKCKGYTSYLDDFVFFGRTKGEVKAKMKRLMHYAKEHGYKLHEPKIRRVSEGLDTMGYVFYTGGNMYWRKSDKVRWLRRRHGVTNPKRLREIDSAAWGMIKWGNRHCKELFKRYIKKDMGIKLNQSTIKRTEKVDKNGVPYIDLPKVNMGMLLNNPITIKRWVTGLETRQGSNRYCLAVNFAGGDYKLIVNSIDIKALVDDMERSHVTQFKTVFYDKGGLKYSFRNDETEILEVWGLPVELRGGIAVYSDNGEVVDYNVKPIR